MGAVAVEQAATVKFYTEVMGWYLIMQPTETVEDNNAIGEMCTKVFGQGWGSFKIAHLSTGDRIGVEIFQFKNQVNPEDNFEYWKPRIFHFCVQDQNLEELAERINDAKNAAYEIKNLHDTKNPHSYRQAEPGKCCLCIVLFCSEVGVSACALLLGQAQTAVLNAI